MSDNRDHLRALFDAYIQASGCVLTLSPTRTKTLREFDRRGITPDDVRWVVQVIKGRVDRGVQGYSETSLEWKNVMGVGIDIDRFEDRLATLRAARARKKGREREAQASRPAPVSVQTGAADTVSRLDVLAGAPAEPERVGPSLTERVLAKIEEDRRAKGGA